MERRDIKQKKKGKTKKHYYIVMNNFSILIKIFNFNKSET